MTEILQDNVDTVLQIGTTGETITEGSSEPGTYTINESDGIFWDVVEMEVELTQAPKPNYAKGKVTPKPQYRQTLQEKLDISAQNPGARATAEGETPNRGFSRLIGSKFVFEAQNNFVAQEGADTTTVPRASDPSADSDDLLFNGRLANISPIGTDLYKVTAYDPGQQVFNFGESSGSLINQKLELTGNTVSGLAGEPLDPSEQAAIPPEPNNEPGEYEIAAEDLVNFIVREAGFSKKVVDTESLQQFGAGPRGIRLNLGGEDIYISFKKSVVTVKKALNKLRNQARAEYWFDKDGTFYFGDPATLGGGVSTYRVNLITDTSAGITTPPYQSVRVIGSGVASESGWAGNAKIQSQSDKIVKEANIGLPDTTPGSPAIQLDPGTLFEPTFKFIDSSISTEQTAENTALKIADKLIAQQAEGTVTVVGFPEIQPFDGILLPNTPDQPMGGQLYDVYAVKHRLNADDGFITEISVAGPNPNIRGTIDGSEAGKSNQISTPLDLDNAVYTPDGETRAFAPGAGEGDPDREQQSEAPTNDNTQENDSSESVQGPGTDLV
jgi:hypothetical protein